MQLECTHTGNKNVTIVTSVITCEIAPCDDVLVHVEKELKERVRDIMLERQLTCSLERVSYKLELFNRYGVAIEERHTARSLRTVADALETALECLAGGP
jgi:Cft2 family RNA processing exonuclease